jgi:hypothetical protein
MQKTIRQKTSVHPDSPNPKHSASFNSPIMVKISSPIIFQLGQKLPIFSGLWSVPLPGERRNANSNIAIYIGEIS